MLGALGAAIALAFAPWPSAGAAAGLTEPEWQRLERGAVVVKTQPMEDYPWPEVTVYRRVAASPEEVMAVYADFEGQAAYLPKLVESRIVKRLSRSSFQVFYEYEVTGPNELYTVVAEVSRSPRGFRVVWELVTARYARRLSGQMRVEAHGAGTLIEYTNRVDPGFLGGRLGSPETTARQLRDTAEALASHVDRLRAEQPEKLGALIHALKAMLGES